MEIGSHSTEINTKLYRLIEHFKKHEGVEFVTMAEISDDFKKRNTPVEGALMPAKAGEMLKK